MKNIIKSTIVFAAFGLFALLGVNKAFAVDFLPYSGAGGTYATITRISNYTDCPGCYTWNDYSVSADPGEEVTVDVFIQPTATVSDVKVAITPGSYGPALSHTFTGKIYVGATLSESDTATVNVTGGTPESINYESATFKYYPPGCYLTACAVTTPPMGESMAALFAGGISIPGPIAPGAVNSRHVQIRYKLSDTPDVSYACSDGADNDGDGFTDYPADPGCSSATDDDEYNVPPVVYECNDDMDNDGDGLVDWPADPGCSSATDDDEYNAPAPGAPSVTTNDESGVDTDSATLNGYLNTVGTGASYATVYFKWGEGDDFDHTTASSTLYSPGSFSQFISGLDADTEYCFYAYAQNNLGLTASGSTKCFDTDSEDGGGSDIDVTTENADNIDTDQADLNGSIDNNDDNEELEVYFYITDDEDDHTDDDLIDDGDKIMADSSFDDDSGDFSETADDLDPDTEYWYIACFEDEDGDEECDDVESFTTDEENDNGPDDTDQFDLPFVVTTVATQVTGSTARLNGLLTDDGNTATTGWFEWGTTNGLGFRTADQYLGIGDGLAFGNGIFGLSANTTYYYRACARNNGGNMCGDVLNFRTVSTINPVTPVVTGPTVVTVGSGGGTSRLMLEITSPYENACPADINDYTVHYKNISGRTLTDVVLRVTLPSDVMFRKSSAGEYSESDNTVTVELNELSVNEEGEVFISGEVLRGAADEQIIVATAVMAYTFSSTLGQEDAIAYKIHDITRCGNSLAGFALFGNGFFPDTFMGWLLILLLVAVLVTIARRISRGPALAAAPAAHSAPAYQSRSVHDLPH